MHIPIPEKEKKHNLRIIIYNTFCIKQVQILKQFCIHMKAVQLIPTTYKNILSYNVRVHYATNWI